MSHDRKATGEMQVVVNQVPKGVGNKHFKGREGVQSTSRILRTKVDFMWVDEKGGDAIELVF